MRLDELKGQPPTVLDALPAAVLLTLQSQANERAAEVSQLQSILHQVLFARYARGMNKLGTSHIDDGDVRVTVTLPKRVKWDQSMLRKAVDQLATEWGEDPDEYVDVSIDIAERKFDAWPTRIKALFEGARTVETGKPKIELALRELEAA